MIPNKSGKSVTLLACIPRGRYSNLGLKTDNPEALRVFPQVLKANSETLPWTGPLPFPSTSGFSHCSLTPIFRWQSSDRQCCARLQAIIAVLLKIRVFWKRTPFRLVDPDIWKVLSPSMSANVYQSTRHNVPEGFNLQILRATQVVYTVNRGKWLRKVQKTCGPRQ